MDPLDQALRRSEGIVNTAAAQADALKQAGVLGEVAAADAGGMGGLMGGQEESKNRQRYGRFRGWVYAAIHTLASEAGSQPFNLARLANPPSGGEEEGKRTPMRQKQRRRALNRMTPAIRSKAVQREMEMLEDHELVAVLDNPNDFQNRWQFVYSFVANLNLTAWGFVVGERIKGRLQFYSVPTTWITPKHDKGPFSAFVLRNPDKPGTEGREIKRENVGFAYMPNPADPLAGLAPLAAQVMATRIDDHIQTSQERFFENGIFPSVIIKVGKNPHPDVPAMSSRPRLTAAQRREVYNAIGKVTGGIANYGRPAIVDGLIEGIERLSATQNEMGWDKSEEKVRTRILSAFGVHPYILGEPVNVGGYAQAAKIEERFCKRVNVFLDMLSNMMTNLSGGLLEDTSLLAWWDKCEPHDPSLHWQNLREARKAGDLRQDEMRALLGFPPDEDLNQREYDKGALAGIVQIMTNVAGGGITAEQGVAALEGMGLPTDLATRIAGKQQEQAEEDEDEDEGVPAPIPPEGDEGGGEEEPPEEDEGGEEEGELAAATAELKRAIEALNLTPNIAEAIDLACRVR